MWAGMKRLGITILGTMITGAAMFGGAYLLYRFAVRPNDPNAPAPTPGA